MWMSLLVLNKQCQKRLFITSVCLPVKFHPWIRIAWICRGTYVGEGLISGFLLKKERNPITIHLRMSHVHFVKQKGWSLKIWACLIYKHLPVMAACPQVHRADPILLGNGFRMLPGTLWQVNKCDDIGNYINTNNSISVLNHQEKHCDFQE